MRLWLRPWLAHIHVLVRSYIADGTKNDACKSRQAETQKNENHEQEEEGEEDDNGEDEEEETDGDDKDEEDEDFVAPDDEILDDYENVDFQAVRQNFAAYMQSQMHLLRSHQPLVLRSGASNANALALMPTIPSAMHVIQQSTTARSTEMTQDTIRYCETVTTTRISTIPLSSSILQLPMTQRPALMSPTGSWPALMPPSPEVKRRGIYVIAPSPTAKQALLQTISDEIVEVSGKSTTPKSNGEWNEKLKKTQSVGRPEKKKTQQKRSLPRVQAKQTLAAKAKFTKKPVKKTEKPTDDTAKENSEQSSPKPNTEHNKKKVLSPSNTNIANNHTGPSNDAPLEQSSVQRSSRFKKNVEDTSPLPSQNRATAKKNTMTAPKSKTAEEDIVPVEKHSEPVEPVARPGPVIELDSSTEIDSGKESFDSLNIGLSLYGIRECSVVLNESRDVFVIDLTDDITPNSANVTQNSVASNDETMSKEKSSKRRHQPTDTTQSAAEENNNNEGLNKLTEKRRRTEIVINTPKQKSTTKNFGTTLLRRSLLKANQFEEADRIKSKGIRVQMDAEAKLMFLPGKKLEPNTQPSAVGTVKIDWLRPHSMPMWAIHQK